MNSADLLNAVSLVSSVASLMLAVIAIWLSFMFYRMSNQSSDAMNKASTDIHEGVIKIQELFDRLYKDTFAMMRDTVSNMQKHIWPDKMSDVTAAEEVMQEKTEKRIAELKEQMNAELMALLAKQKNIGGGTESLTREFMPILNKAINESNKVTVQTREETIREAIMTVLIDLANNHTYTVSADELVGRIDKKYALSFGDTLNTLRNLRDEGLIHWEGPEYVLSSTRININPDILRKIAATSKLLPG